MYLSLLEAHIVVPVVLVYVVRPVYVVPVYVVRPVYGVRDS